VVNPILKTWGMVMQVETKSTKRWKRIGLPSIAQEIKDFKGFLLVATIFSFFTYKKGIKIKTVDLLFFKRIKKFLKNFNKKYTRG